MKQSNNDDDDDDDDDDYLSAIGIRYGNVTAVRDLRQAKRIQRIISKNNAVCYQFVMRDFAKSIRDDYKQE
jgi:hypothetical protein